MDCLHILAGPTKRAYLLRYFFKSFSIQSLFLFLPWLPPLVDDMKLKFWNWHFNLKNSGWTFQVLIQETGACTLGTMSLWHTHENYLTTLIWLRRVWCLINRLITYLSNSGIQIVHDHQHNGSCLPCFCWVLINGISTKTTSTGTWHVYFSVTDNVHVSITYRNYSYEGVNGVNWLAYNNRFLLS